MRLPLPAVLTAEGGRSADQPTCPCWQEERRVATLLAASPTPLSRRAVAVREESREVRSYAAAVRAYLLENTTADPGLPRRSLPRLSPPAAPPAEPAEDPRDALIAKQFVALQAVGDFLPPDHPMRSVCLQAASAQSGATKGD
ncbi:hypothetical protein MTO96_048154 [Rhipicephalus appendiculatus]